LKNNSLANSLQKSSLILFVLFTLTLANAQDFYTSKMVSCSAGEDHSMAIDESGNLWAWGDNRWGQLGDGTSYHTKSKPELIFSHTKIRTVSAGEGFTMVIDESGGLWAMGENGYGQLGNGISGYIFDGVPNYEIKPIQIKSGIKFRTVSAGGNHSLAIDESGNIWAWGANNYGQLGNGTTTNENLPILVESTTKFVSVSAGGSSLAIDESGDLWVWGCGSSFSAIKKPVHLKYSTKFIAISAGKWHNLALDESGNLWSWGINYSGELGDGSIVSRYEPVMIQSETKFKYVSAGNSFSLAIDESGNIWAWGYNYTGQLGNGDGGIISSQDNSSFTKCVLKPEKIETKVKFQTVSAGYAFCLAIDEKGNQWVWGDNVSGQLGYGNAGKALLPVSLKSENQYIAISAGGKHSLAVDEFGNLWAWGDNVSGQLGDSTNSSKSTPVMVKSDIKFDLISLGGFHSLALDESGNLWGWGNNGAGQLGDGTMNYRKVPGQIKSGTKFNYISAGKYYSLAIDNTGKLWACGINGRGQLGNSSTATEYSFVQVKPEIKFQKVSDGEAHTLAIDVSGRLWSWGYNYSGQLGDGTESDKKSPVQIMPDKIFQEISAGSVEYGGYSLAIDDSGNLWAWGYNGYGQLGFDSLSSISSPIMINKGLKFKTLSTGKGHTLVIDQTGDLWACGDNSSGQLGNGTISYDNKYLHRIESNLKFKTVSARDEYSLAIDESGTIWAWGDNSYGQLGDGTAWSEVPICINNPSINTIAKLLESFGTKAYGITNQITIQSETPETYTLYNLMGGKVANGKLQPGETSIPAQPGIYIFNAGGYRTKVLVK
jgi:alpha-tubulin suppressor-like RCC1 family protein